MTTPWISLILYPGQSRGDKSGSACMKYHEMHKFVRCPTYPKRVHIQSDRFRITKWNARLGTWQWRSTDKFKMKVPNDRWFWHVLTHYHVYQSNKPVWSYLFGPDSHLLRWQPIPPWWLRWWLHWRYGSRTQSTQCSSVGWRVFVPCCQWCPRVSIACLMEQFQWTAMFGLYI